MYKTRLILFTILGLALLAIICTIVGIATPSWITINSGSFISNRIGLFKQCTDIGTFPGIESFNVTPGCTNKTQSTPVALAIIGLLCIFFAFIITLATLFMKNLSPIVSIVPATLFLLAAIFIMCSIVIYWPYTIDKELITPLHDLVLQNGELLKNSSGQIDTGLILSNNSNFSSFSPTIFNELRHSYHLMIVAQVLLYVSAVLMAFTASAIKAIN
ncbi:unnamed protein product [Didymodactylos carnosus]|uniref:Uncharacterized protein n=1 Tax=Didymodactylos carnosus TaxID=1234261 RepID=A0A8S2S3X6_9BILA|nr:unnamed protein product [Didymodactylos carnosus]CAF4203552.1 unnamed protein product [Didymodactylos carnosus]